MIAIIIKREVKSILTDIGSHALVSAFLLVAIYLFFNLLATYNQALVQQAQISLADASQNLNINTWVVNSYYQTLLFMLVLFAPPISAGCIAQERGRGTLELLLTLPLRARSIVLAKFFSAWFLLSICLLFSALLPVALYLVETPDLAILVLGLSGLLLVAAAFVAICIACSVLVNSTVFAGVLSLALLITLYSIHMPAESLSLEAQTLLRYFSPLWQLKEFFEGVLTLKPLIYFTSLTFVALFVASSCLHSQRLRV